MAGSVRRGRGLILGLALTFAGVAPSLSSLAEPSRGGDLVAVVAPEDAASTPEPMDERAKAVARVQRCFAELGYYKGPIDGKANADTWTAHWYFKNDHGLRAYGDFLAKPVQKKLDELCKDEPPPAPDEQQAMPDEQQAVPDEQQAVPDAPSSEADETVALAPQDEEPAPAEEVAADVEEVAAAEGEMAVAEEEEEEEPEPAIPLVRLDFDCLPEDLIERLRSAHGQDVRIEACGPACLPQPAGLTQSQLDELQTRNGIVWCRSCVSIKGHLSLNDVRRIEREGGLELCTVPPRHLPRTGSGNGNVSKSYTRIRALYRALPPVAVDDPTIAVVIGNHSYDKLPPADTARNDAGAVYAFLTEHLGYRQENIIDMRDAKKADLERLFGPEPGTEGELARFVGSRPESKVVIYYSGHGATNGDHTETYLMPVDAEPYREELAGYPLSTLYANLAALPARSVLVLLESEFGRDHGSYTLPPNLPETTRSILPRSPLPAVTVLAASDRGQRTLIDTQYDTGLFTRYLIEGLAGSADLYPVGNGDGMVDSAEIYVYTATMVRLAARKTFGLLQEPVYSSASTSVLSSAGALAAGPN